MRYTLRPKIITIVMLLCLLNMSIIAFVGCSKNDKKNIENLPNKRKIFISGILDTLTVPTPISRLLFTSSLTCQTCIENAINSFSALPNANEFAIIPIGSSQKETEYLNYFYSRQRIKFIFVQPTLLDSLLVQDKAFASSLVYCVRLLPNGNREFFDGVLQDTSQYVNSRAAVEFLIGH